jgi:hypothetical protein
MQYLLKPINKVVEGVGIYINRYVLVFNSMCKLLLLANRKFPLYR